MVILIILYVNLFESPFVAEYSSLVESLGWKIYLFLREEKSRKIIFNNEKYIKSIIIGMNKIMTNQGTEGIILRILTILLKEPNSDEQEFELQNENAIEYEKNSKILKRILELVDIKPAFDSLISYFSKHLNTKLTTYCYDLDNCKQYCIDGNFNNIICKFI